MIRALWLFLVVSAVTLGALWIAGLDGLVTVTLPGSEIKLALAAALMLLALFVATSIFVYRLFSLLGLAPDAFSRWSEQRRQKKGYLALTRGLVAAAAGDGLDARRHTRTALTLVGEPPLALLLAAQSAQLEGDEDAAEKYFAAMLQSPEMEFLGVRGLYMAASRKGDAGKALEWATRAFALRPKAPWVVNALFDLQSQNRQWAMASQTLDAVQKAKLLDSGVTKRRRAVLKAALAQEAEEQGDGPLALSLAQDALAIAPGLTAAALIAAKYLSAQGRHWKASAILEAAWAKEPHPGLARAYANLKPDEAARSRSWRLSGLAAQKPDHPESRILAASVAMGASDWQSAKESMRALANSFPAARICTLMADIERHAGNEAEARGWAQRALRSPRDAIWSCASCARQYSDWSALCPGCHAFDTLAWLSGAAEKVTKMPHGEDITGVQADTGDMTTSLYRDSVKPDEAQTLMVRATPSGPDRPQRDEVLQPVIFQPDPAPDDPGPDHRDWDEAGDAAPIKRGAGW
jgi:HemY protein